MKTSSTLLLVSVLLSSVAGAVSALLITAEDHQNAAREAVISPAVMKHPPSAVSTLPPGPPPAFGGAMGTSVPMNFRKAANKALDAVVHVRTAQRLPASGGWFGWPGYFQPQQQGGSIQQGSGSGVVMSEDGYIVTNHHVIEGADVIEVGFNDNRTMAAALVGSDPTTDIAVLKVEGQGLSPMEWGDSDAVQIGDWVLAVGNPFDLTSTVTAGIVSAKARDIQLLRPDYDRSLFPVESFIQTDAAVNPGNSGGALVDVEGQLVGINTAIASRTGSYAGYAFAVPANLAGKVARDLIEFGTVQRAYLGVNVRPVDESMAGRLDLPAVAGVLVADVNDHSGAEQAGIQVGDVILSVEGTETGSIPQLLERVSRFRPGQTASVQVWRDGGVLSFEVELGRRDGLLPDAPEGTGDSDEDAAASVFGCLVKPAQDGLEGVLVLKVGPGPFRNAGVTKGMVITAVDNTPVQGVEDLIHALEQAGRSGQRGILLEGLDSNGAPLWFGVNPG